MEFEKVKVSKEISEALEELMEMCRHNRVEAVDEFFQMRYYWEENGDLVLARLDEFGTDNFVRALYYGYEVE